MKEHFQFDLGTLYAIGIIISLLFGTVLLLLARAFRQVRGAAALGQGFLAVGFGIIFFLLRRSMPLTASVVLANGLLWLGYMLFYTGIAKSIGVRARLAFPLTIATAAFCAITYFTAITNRIPLRIEIIAATDCLLLINMFTDLLRQHRRGMVIKLLAVFVGFAILSNIFRGVATFLHGASPDIFQYDPIQAFYTVCGLFAACGLGIFSLVLLGRQVTALLEQGARRGIEELLAVELERSRSTRIPLSLALLDIDHFKAFNDSGGHAAGDDVLRNVATTIARHLRPYDACGRLGGDEFLLVSPSCTATDLSTLCDHILRDVAALPSPTSATVSPTLSIGYTQSGFGDTTATLLARADRALYAAKRHGRNCAHLELPPNPSRPSDPPAHPVPTRKTRFRRAASSIRRFRP